MRAEPTLYVSRDEDGLTLTLQPRPPDGEAVWCERSERRRIAVYELTDLPRRLGELVGKELRVPSRGEARVRKLLAEVAAVLPVHSDVALGGDAAEERPADPRPVVTLSRQQEGLHARIAVQPLGLEGPRLSPGEGPAEVVAPVGGRPLRVQRDLDAERAQLRALLSACPTLAGATHDLQASLPDPVDCLEALDELRGLGEDVVLLWPEGRPIAVEDERGAEHLRLRLQAKGKEWFAASGALDVDEDLVLDLRALLDRLPERRGRFVRLDEGRFVALTQDLLNRLHTLRAADSDEDDGVRLHPLAAGLVAQWGDEMPGLRLDAKARGRLERVRAAASMTPAIPATLDVELRDYQREGFTWMSRLAHWGAGACLADDMGLGKTVQALAVLTARAAEGPALVIAPTSVCATWVDEAIRFAPALRPRVLSGPTSAEELEALEPFDVAICSYTHLALNADALASTRFATAVLDEAQAIKNPSTQRAKAAFRLQADFRLATTGTPVENHLHELWSLMRFLNPGLLGTQKAFERRFARPVQQRGDHRALDELRALVRSFVLRRQKRDVLKELPPRTEVVLDVVPSEEERAFSEALRRRALERFEGEGRSASESAMTLLAELTRLRQAACHPALVDPECGIGSAKLDQLVELLEELVDGGHRALVFSQFVTYLEHARRRLDDADITYQYLDGSTPTKQRKAAVNAFQSGEGDAFLISLKAGGTGLTLTGADYVVHLDPWWNPAVEGQASDRAHRIGQRRPVTIYKLVTKGSIEERVLQLHGDKRHLAERLLADTDTAKTPDAETLLALLRDTEAEAEAAKANNN